ncbi:DNA cytosine methyltransferase [Allorhodopirellula solitaria]|uniref:DNA (cytosine-5-)-methyltransferase n=1 Tax=Allorhodopirellula solitaria TaxID=2527987 RepID=A0A5C5XWX8_9BACT|nr:DNA cytosine methyltransferase [Allorhodopirellula solitaria]TWT66405.1 Modification methylase HhaI [Allorhodopirellula solitaria]
MSAFVELFCGLGGVSESVRQFNCVHSDERALNVIRAVDINRDCAAVHEHNFGLAVDCRSLESMNLHEITATHPHQTWWLSPPCQPYCRRGRGQPQRDRRCDAIQAITRFLARSDTLPSVVILENVPEFASSQDAADLRKALGQREYATWSGDLCPTQFGVPNLRRRHYLIARRDAGEVASPRIAAPTRQWNFPIASILDEDAQTAPELWVDRAIVDSYRTSMDIVDPDDVSARAACFGSGYGKSIIRSGSYLRRGDRVRRFSPTEVARLLGFSPQFRFPDRIGVRRRWKMLGNSVSVFVVRAVLESASPAVARSAGPR